MRREINFSYRVAIYDRGFRELLIMREEFDPDSDGFGASSLLYPDELGCLDAPCKILAGCMTKIDSNPQYSFVYPALTSR